jgi:VanZ family protein
VKRRSRSSGTKESGIKCRFEVYAYLQKISFFRYWFPLLIYCILIFLQSSFPSIESGPELPYSDKLLHFFAYTVLGALFFRAYKTLRVRNRLNLLIMLSILSSSLYGASDELHQHFVPYRSAEWMDIFADVLGSVFGVFIYQYISARFSDNRFNHRSAK